MPFSRYFVRPPAEVYESPEYSYHGPYRTYTHYNYLRPGLLSFIKTRHFEAVLRLTRDRFGEGDVMEFGCGDGAFLPSLSRHFRSVTAVEIDPASLAIAERAVSHLGLGNVRPICNRGMSVDELAGAVRPALLDVIFVLEVLEHLGEPGRANEARIELLEGLLGMLRPDGRIIVTVPAMTGSAFFLYRAAAYALRMPVEPIRFGELCRACVLGDTRDLEKRWRGDHLGFNERTLERRLRERFPRMTRKDLYFQKLFVIPK